MSEPRDRHDLSITALYTGGVWASAGFSRADLYASTQMVRVFRVVEGVLALARALVGGPSLRHSLVQRHVMFDAWVREVGPRVVLELAAGLSARGARFTDAPGLRWIEADLPMMILEKVTLLDRTPEGRAVAVRPSLRRVAVDVTDDDMLDVVRPAGRAAVLAEGLVMYLPAAQRRDLFRRVAAWIGVDGGAFAFDLVPPAEKPPPGWVARMLAHLMRRATGGTGIEEVPLTRAEIEAELSAAGFVRVLARAPADAPPDWAVPHLEETTEQLVWTAYLPGRDTPT